MKDHDVSRIRSVAVVAQGGVGKTTLCEALLYSAGVMDRMGSVTEGTTLMDFEPEETKRAISISAAVCSFQWQGHKIHLIDTPGYSHFIGDTRNCLRVAGGAIVVLCAVPQLKVQTENLWALAGRLGRPRIIFVTMMDRERADFFGAVKELDEVAGGNSLIMQLPIGAEQGFQGVVDLLTMKAHIYKDDRSGRFSEEEIPGEMRDRAEELRLKLIEKIAESQDSLLEKYLEAGELSPEEIALGLKDGIRERKFAPVLVGSGTKNIGMPPLLNLIIAGLPSPVEEGAVSGRSMTREEKVAREPRGEGPLTALVFKTVADPFAGKLNLFRVYSGRLASDSVVYNASRKTRERIGQVFELEGKKQRPVGFLIPGDIGAVAKLKETGTGDTLCDEKEPILMDFIEPLTPVISFAVEPKSKGDEEKVSGALSRLREEDPTLSIHRDEQTKEIIMGGLGQIHIETVVEKMKRKFGVEVSIKSPKVPYKETIKGTVQVQGKYKRQSGGRGQYGDTWLELSPQPRGKGFEFVNSIVGGAIPRNYIPSVERGIVEAMVEGVLAGYPVVDIQVLLYDGSYHAVDSSDMAFKIAGSIGFKKGFLEANPILLEPVMLMEVIVPDDKLGDVIGDLNSRRGKVLGVDPRGNNQVIKAHVPMAEVLRYASDLRSMTSDRGEFTMELSHYEEVPAHQAERIIAESKKGEGGSR